MTTYNEIKVSGEMFNFANKCYALGWPCEKTCNALGISKKDVIVIKYVYSNNNNAFSICPSDDESYFEDD